MRASMLAKEPRLRRMPAGQPRLVAGQEPCAAHPSLAAQLAVIREMLATLDTLTAAGQCYVMRKVVAFIQDELARLRPQGGLAETLISLMTEAQQRWPDSRRFCSRAESLMKRLEKVA